MSSDFRTEVGQRCWQPSCLLQTGGPGSHLGSEILSSQVTNHLENFVRHGTSMGRLHSLSEDEGCRQRQMGRETHNTRRRQQLVKSTHLSYCPSLLPYFGLSSRQPWYKTSYFRPVWSSCLDKSSTHRPCCQSAPCTSNPP